MTSAELATQQTPPSLKTNSSNRYRRCLVLICGLTLTLYCMDMFVTGRVVPHFHRLVGATITKMADDSGHNNTATSVKSLPSVFIKSSTQNQTRFSSSPPTSKKLDLRSTNLKLGPAGIGGSYLPTPSAAISAERREQLQKEGLEPAEDHVFKSPLIETPIVYPQARVQGQQVKAKVISVFNAPGWYKRSWPYNLNAYNWELTHCPYNRCVLDLAGSRQQEADLVIFFVGSLGNRQPPSRPRGQLWAKAYWESPIHYYYPKNYAQWKSVFNLTYNYRLDSDIFAPNNRLAWRHRDLLLSDEEYLRITRSKSKPVAWWVSNCRTQSKRMEYVQEMKKYIDVDIYGGCSKLKCHKETMGDCKKLLNTTYSFYLSFENSLCRDYITEKFYRNFESRTHILPVVRGGADYERLFLSDSFVNAKNFPKARDLALYLKTLLADEKRYARMLREKDRLVALGYKHDWCELCRRMHTEGFPAKTIPDIRAWSHKETCNSPEDIR